METYKLSLKFEVEGVLINTIKTVTTQSYAMIVEQTVNELCSKYGLNQSDIHVEVIGREHNH